MRKKFDTPNIEGRPIFMIDRTITNNNQRVQFDKIEKIISEASLYMNTCNEPIYIRLVILYYYL
jgi:hypothetical protein